MSHLIFPTTSVPNAEPRSESCHLTVKILMRVIGPNADDNNVGFLGFKLMPSQRESSMRHNNNAKVINLIKEPADPRLGMWDSF